MKQPADSAVVIGSGIGGLAAACLLGKAGYAVTVHEKNGQLGGRVGLIDADGFRFDSGPSWFLMKDVYEHFFELMDEDANDHLKLEKLSPSYRVFYKYTRRNVDIYSDLKRDAQTFGQIEPGAGQQLKNYLDRSASNYKVAKDHFMYKNYDTLKDLLTTQLVTKAKNFNLFGSLHKDVGRYFRSQELQQIMEFPALFLGASPYKTPALFGIMNHVLFDQGVFYPRGSMYAVTDALVKVAKNYGVQFKLNSPVQKIIVKNGRAAGIKMADGKWQMANVVISNAGLHHTDTALLPPKFRTKPKKYWQKCDIAPSALLIYLGVKGSLPPLAHHNLFFSKDWQQNFKELFNQDSFPTDPSFYVCCPSKTDKTAAPKGHENLFILVPVSARLNPAAKELEPLARSVLASLAKEIRVPDLEKRVVYRRLFGPRDFAKQYNSYKGSALGLSHTLRQSAAFRPGNINKKVKNLYYVGADTSPGIGIPPALISAELAYTRLVHNKNS